MDNARSGLGTCVLTVRNFLRGQVCSLTADGDAVPKPLRFIRLEISDGNNENGNISAAAFHRIISQPASGRSSALPCLAANIVLSKLLWEIHLHGLKFIPLC